MNSADQLSLYAPKRVRDAAHAERRGMAPKSQEGVEGSDAHQSTAASPAQDGGPVADHYRLARSLEPTLMPEPCPVPPARSGIGVLARFAVAIAIAAIGALFVVGKFPTSWTVSAMKTRRRWDRGSPGRMLVRRSNQSHPFRNSACARKVRARRTRHFRSAPRSPLRPRGRVSSSTVSPTDRR